MKFVINFSFKPGLTNQDREDERKVFLAWEPDPSLTFHQSVQRFDASGVAVAMVETDNAAPLLQTALMFGRRVRHRSRHGCERHGPAVDQVLGQLESVLGRTGTSAS